MRDPLIISVGKMIINVGKYIVYEIKLILRKGDDYLSDRMPIWFSNTRYYVDKKIVDNALKSVYSSSRNEKPFHKDISDWTKDSIESFKGTDHTPLDLGYRDIADVSRDRVKKRFRDNEVEGDNYPDVVMNGNWKPVDR